MSTPTPTPTAERKKIGRLAQFIIGGISGMTGWMFIHPIDVLKVRMQLSTEGATKEKIGNMQMFKSIASTEGPLALYNGLSAGLVRQASYGTFRIGFFEMFKGFLMGESKEEVLWKNGLAGTMAGACASFLANPVEVSLVRMQADGKKPVEARRNYKHIFDALIRIYREEGVMTYFRGVTPTVGRAMVVNCTQLATYSQSKFWYKKYLNMKEGILLHFASSLTAGFIYSLASLPLDNAKTRMQNSSAGSQYSSLFRTLGLIARNEGTLCLWNGFMMYFTRCGGHTIAMFIAMEQYRKLYLKYI